jgi:transcriptional regulator with XRE-family HTH domain
VSSIDIFVENLNRIAKHNNLETYKEIADYLHVTEDALKRWQNKSRTPSLKKIDEISDRVKCYSYALLQKDGNLFVEIECIKNDSRKALLSNLREYFMQRGRFSWNEKAALFYGFVSEDALKSYFREKNFKTPPLSKLDEMAEALGKPAYELIKEGESDEKANT